MPGFQCYEKRLHFNVLPTAALSTSANRLQRSCSCILASVCSCSGTTTTQNLKVKEPHAFKIAVKHWFLLWAMSTFHVHIDQLCSCCGTCEETLRCFSPDQSLLRSLQVQLVLQITHSTWVCFVQDLPSGCRGTVTAPDSLLQTH